MKVSLTPVVVTLLLSLHLSTGFLAFRPTFLPSPPLRYSSTSTFSTLIIGDGDLSYGAYLSQTDEHSHSHSHSLTVTVLETEETHATTYANSASNSNTIKQNGGTLLHSVDVTNPSTLPKSSSLFSTIIFNFPHVPGKSNNLHNRNLLKSFFQNVGPLLHPSGSIKVVLNSPQSGFDSLTSIDWKASWNLPLQVLPSHVLTSVDPFDINHNLSSYRGSDKSFTTVSPQTYTFKKSGKVCEGKPNRRTSSQNNPQPF